MVDPERLVAVLGRVTARLRVLEQYRDAEPAALLADEVRLGHLKYTFQTALEACIDAGHHVVADKGLGVPASHGHRATQREGCHAQAGRGQDDAGRRGVQRPAADGSWLGVSPVGG